MFETVQKYSEQTYYSKEDLEREMDHYLVEPLWHEILQYRNFFKLKFPIQQKATYLVRNPYVNDCIARTQEAIYAYMQAHYKDRLQMCTCTCLYEDEQLFYQSFLSQLQHNTYYDHGRMLMHVMEQCNLQQNITKDAMQYLMRHHNVLLQLFMCFANYDERTCFLLVHPILRLHGILPIANQINYKKWIEICSKIGNNLDVTGMFLSFLAHIRLKLSTEMLLLDAYGESDETALNKKELIEKFPALPKDAICFYVGHREPHHYYTLQDYMEMHHCCYETARSSMEKLVSLKWYQKQKMGKKFVYFIL